MCAACMIREDQLATGVSVGALVQKCLTAIRIRTKPQRYECVRGVQAQEAFPTRCDRLLVLRHALGMKFCLSRDLVAADSVPKHLKLPEAAHEPERPSSPAARATPDKKKARKHLHFCRCIYFSPCPVPGTTAPFTVTIAQSLALYPGPALMP